MQPRRFDGAGDWFAPPGTDAVTAPAHPDSIGRVALMFLGVIVIVVLALSISSGGF